MGIEVDEVPAFITGGEVGRRSATRFDKQLVAFCKAVRKSSPVYEDQSGKVRTNAVSIPRSSIALSDGE